MLLMTAASALVCVMFAVHEVWVRHPALHFIPLPLAALLWLLPRQAQHAARPSAICRWLAVAHLALALAAFVLVSPFLAGLAFLLAMTALASAQQAGNADATPAWALPALALFLIPPPMMLDQDLHHLLAGLAARLSQVWLDTLGVLNVVQGTIVATPEKRFFVDDACSGTQSMLAAICTAVVVCGVRRRAWPQALLVVLTASLISIVSNVLRICLVISAPRFWGFDLDEGWRHEAVGVLFFILDLLLVCSADRGCHFLLNLRPEAPPSWTKQRAAAPAGIAGSWFAPLSTLIAMVGAVMILGPEMLARSHTPSVSGFVRDPGSREEFRLPGELSGWVRAGEKPVEDAIIGKLGVRNQVWVYRKNGLEAFVAVNFPFRGFHDTRLCYNGQGWQFRRQVDAALPGEKDNTVRFLEMSQPAEMTRAHLWLSVLDERGHPLKFASENPLDRMGERLWSRWSHPESATGTTYVLQVLAIEPEGEQRAQDAFTELLAGARHCLAEAIFNRSPSAGKESE